jgi:hypothetical protein
MFGSRKRVFANKRNTLYARPLCPYFTDEAGYARLSRKPSAKFTPANCPPKYGKTFLR